MELDTKWCRRCDETKALESFNVCNLNKDGRYTYCKECCKVYRKDGGYNDYTRYAEQNRVRQRNYRQTETNKEYDRQYRRVYHMTNEGRAAKVVSSAKTRSKKRGIDFDLTTEWVLEKLNAGICEATGIEFDYKIPEGRTRSYRSPSIDRKDNTKGYTQENCWVVCLMYNIAKGENSEDELLDMATRLVERSKNK